MMPSVAETGGDTISPRSLREIASLRVVPQRHYGRWISVAVIFALLALIVKAFAEGKIAWDVVGQYLTAPAILAGVGNTIVMTILAMSVGVVIGAIVAVMRESVNPVLRSVAIGYAWLFRGVPVLLQCLIWYNLALVFPIFGVEVIWSVRMVDAMTPFMAALLGLGLSQAAYTSEIFRSGMLSVDAGQYEAAQTIGMTRLMALRRIVFPQAMRVVIPPLGNEFIGMVKTTSLASVIQYTEVMFNAETIYYANTRVVELLFVACFWYLIAVSILTMVQMPLERRFSRGVAGR
jgi:polar amino acid transport system permease protein